MNDSSYNDYRNIINKFIYDDNIQSWNFKSNKKYQDILEHVSPQSGQMYLQNIYTKYYNLFTNNKQFILDLCNKNDQIGKPIKYNFQNLCECSPSNLRYILHSFLILDFMNECNLNEVDVIEIGGGYGGLCFFLNNLSKLFNIMIKSYTIFDLNEPLLLQEKYLKNLNIQNVYFNNTDNFNNLKNNSFLISNYAFSEISVEYQKIYTTNVLNPYTSHGFLTWNFIDVYNFVDDRDIFVESEYPLTHHTNKYVRYKPKIK